MNISIKNKFSMIIVFMSILSLIFAYVISNEVVSKNILEKEEKRAEEKVFYLNRELKIVEDKVFNEAINISQNSGVIEFFLDINKFNKEERLKQEEQLSKYFGKRIISKSDLLKNVDIQFLYKKGSYIFNTKENYLDEEENIDIALGLKNNFPQDYLTYIYDPQGRLYIKSYSPIINSNLKDVLGGVVVSYEYDKFILEYLKKSYDIELILRKRDLTNIMTTFEDNLDEAFVKEDIMELGKKSYLTKTLAISDLDLELLLAFDRQRVLDEKSEISSYLFIALFFVFTLLFIISSTVLNIFIDSLKRLTIKINSLKDGNFNINLGSLKNNNDEIGILAHDFENMVHILKNKIKELEEANLNNKHYSTRLEKANEELKLRKNNIEEKSENIERINKLLNSRITEITNMYYLMVNSSKYMLDDKFYEIILKGVREGLILPKVAIYLQRRRENQVELKKSFGFDNIPKKINIEASKTLLMKKDSIEAEEIFSGDIFGDKEHLYLFPLVTKREDEEFYGFMLLSKNEKLNQDFKKSVLTYVNALLLVIENRKFYLQLLSENKKLEETTKELQESEKMKNIFISNISHELRIPLVPIKGYHEIILEERMGRLNEKQKKAMKTSLKNIERLQEIIENILNYSRIESGKYQILNTPLNIKDIFEEVLIRLENVLEEKTVDLIKKFPKDSAVIYADREALKQIFINLISNSIKFAEGTEVEIILKIDEEVDRYRVSIKDNGVGMDKSKIEQVLKSFRQLEEGNTRRYRGLGLGLTVVDKILAYYGEKIYMNSEKGEGTEVYFYFKKGERG